MRFHECKVQHRVLGNIGALAAAACLFGCAARQPPSMTATEVAEYNNPVECTGAEECALLWRRAQAWVAQNSGFKIQVATEMVLETFSAPNYSMRWAFRAVRQPMGKNSERIIIEPSCGQAPLCTRSRDSLVAAFNAYVRAAK